MSQSPVSVNCSCGSQEEQRLRQTKVQSGVDVSSLSSPGDEIWGQS